MGRPSRETLRERKEEATPEEEEATLVDAARADEADVARGAAPWSWEAPEGGRMAEEKEPLQLDEREVRLF